MPACKHGAWDYCGQCLAEYELEQPVRVTQSPVEIVRKSIPGQDEVARLTGERDEARAELDVIRLPAQNYARMLVRAEQAERERDEAIKNLTMLRIEWRAELATLRALLREVEWSATIQGDEDRCPSCAASKDDGHKADCRLKAALEGRGE